MPWRGVCRAAITGREPSSPSVLPVTFTFCRSDDLMHRLFAMLLLTSSVGGPAVAAEVLVGDAAAGQGKTAVCGACHGPDGNSLVPGFPRLAGQGERYLLKQMQEIKSGKRVVIEMTGMLSGLGDQDLADIAAYYAGQKSSLGAADEKRVARGQALFRGGRLSDGLPACAGCHSPDGAGNAQAGLPRLGGQHADYISKQLTAFREGQRSNDGDTLVMRSIAAKLSNQDIEALAQYIQGLH